jgi:hypothetical protein
MTKRKNAHLSNIGALGNTMRTWTDRRRFCLARPHLCHSMTPIALRAYQWGGRFHINVNPYDIDAGTMKTHFVQEMCDHDHITFHGEAQHVAGGLLLTWSKAKCNQRQAFLEDLRSAAPGESYWMVKQHLDNASWENLWILFEAYPDHVVEFSSFDKPVGELGWNTIFWEVRDY